MHETKSDTARRVEAGRGRAQLDAISQAVHGARATAEMHAVFDALHGDPRPVGGFASYVTDDHSPFEFSLVLAQGGPPELRLLAEPFGETLAETVRAASSTRAWIAKQPGVDFRRFDAIRDLFLPADPQGRFAIWFASTLAPEAPPKFKVYLNPNARGPEAAPALVEEMLERLGLSGAFPFVAEAARRGPIRDQLRFVSLDLEDTATARAKVYLFHQDATAEELAFVAAQAKCGDARATRSFVRTLSGGEGVLRSHREVGTCLSFRKPGRPDGCTLHFPIRAFAGNDLEAKARITRVIEQMELDLDAYHRAIGAIARRPLEAGVGLHSYASLAMDNKGPRLNVYFSPEVYAVLPAVRPSVPVRDAESASSPELAASEAPEAVVREYQETWAITCHPFLKRMARREVDVAGLTLLLRNFQVAITRDFARRLSHVVCRVEETALRSILAKQLNDELGNGDPTRAHSLLFDRLVDGLVEHGPSNFDAETSLAPGRALGEVLEQLYLRADPYEGLGAALIMEVYGQQIDAFMGSQFRRQSALPSAVLEWLTLHEELEVEHVNESIDLANRVPRGVKAAAAARGARALGLAGYRFFDALYALYCP